ncbi:MAG: hypothetical protein ABW168_21975 [Sedimenticola sp.]
MAASNVEEGTEEQDYDETVDENAFLSEVFRKRASLRQFVSRSEKIYARSIKLDSSASSVWLNYETDIDGCVVELSDLKGIELPIRHLTICAGGKFSLKELKRVLKKHVSLVQYSKEALFNFDNSVGIQLFYENGWECWLGLIPDATVRSIRLSRDVIRSEAYVAFEQVRVLLRTKLSEYAKNDVAIRTIMKNDLNDLRKIFIMPDDRYFMMAALQSCVSCIHVKYFRPIVFCFRFGEKMRDGLSLKMFKPEYTKKVTVHAAIDISSSVQSIHLLWSMAGIQQVVGLKGTLSTCLSLTDCGNFQSNLNGKALDVQPELLQVCVHPEKVLFVQLYADVPHLRPKTRFHPVSGIIAGGLCFPWKTSGAFGRDAEKYISSMDHNFLLLRKSSCRLEVVAEVTEVSDRVQATDVIVVTRVDELLEKKGMLVPIPSVTLDCIQQVGLWLTNELRALSRPFAKTGNVGATWRALQFELACEKLLWGRPLCARSFRISVNLGPGVLGASRSLTDQLGFLALDAPTACMQLENSIPDYRIWTASESIGKGIVRAAGLDDNLDASYPVVGRLLMLALLKDLHEIGKVGAYVRFEDFLLQLKREESGLQTVGAIAVESLVELLATKRRTAVHMVFGKLCQLIVNRRLPVKDILKAGVSELGLHHFPAVETYDARRNAVLRWNVRMNFWKVIGFSELSSTADASSALVFSELARCELERRGLIFPSKLKKLPALWPWIAPCLRKLVQEKLSHEATFITLAFLSALAFIMQDWFVDFDQFAKLLQDLPVKQFRLKSLEILSRFELPKFKFQNLMVFRLHHSIPHKLPETKKDDKAAERRQTTEEEIAEIATDHAEDETVGNRIAEDDDDENILEVVQRIEPRASTCYMVGSAPRAWSAGELEFLEEISSHREGRSVQELYTMFRSRCLKGDIPFRTFDAFRAKLMRLA